MKCFGPFSVAVTVSYLFAVTEVLIKRTKEKMTMVILTCDDDDNYGGCEDDDGGCDDDDSLKRLSLMANAIIRSVALQRSNVHEV